MKLDSKYFDKIRVKPSTDKKKAAEAVPQCDWPDCPRPGPHKAPMGRGHEGKFYNYCTAHVQEYNKSYNYFSGMKDDDVQEYQKNSRLGDRPTWKLGQNATEHTQASNFKIFFQSSIDTEESANFFFDNIKLIYRPNQ